MRTVWLAALSYLLVAAAPPIPAPAPPQVAAHVKGGHFDPGDYGWTRGAFPGATRRQTADWQAIRGYATHCAGGPHAEVAYRALQAVGIDPPAGYWQAYGSDVCGEAGIATRTVDGFHDWESYSAALARALPLYRTLLFAVRTAAGVDTIEGGTVRDQLRAIVVPDQVLRKASHWGQGDASEAPPVDADTRRLLVALLWRPIRDYDHRNTAWLEAVIAKDGWPTISVVGEGGAENAWLIAQHADDDPLFQLKVLHMIEPLAKTGEASKDDYALLTDRVLLPLTGKQRYGTQFSCDARTGFGPLPLEDPAHVEQRRAALGIEPLAAYAREMRASYGDKCR